MRAIHRFKTLLVPPKAITSTVQPTERATDFFVLNADWRQYFKHAINIVKAERKGPIRII